MFQVKDTCAAVVVFSGDMPAARVETHQKDTGSMLCVKVAECPSEARHFVKPRLC